MTRRRRLLWIGIGCTVALGVSLQGCGGSSSSPTEPAAPVVQSGGNQGSSGSAPTPDRALGPSIYIEKFTNGNDADLPPGPMIPVGTGIVWTYRVWNNGDVPLTNVQVTDDPAGFVCDALSLGPEDPPLECTLSGTWVEGQYSNVGTVTATPEGGGDPVSASDPSHYVGGGDVVIALDVQKLTNGEDADTPTGPIVLAGDPVEWTYFVTNNSDPDLTVTITTADDDPVGPVTCPANGLPAATPVECTAIASTAQPGQYVNTFTVTATATDETTGDSETVTVSDDSHYFGSAPDVSLEKRTDGQDGALVVAGCPVTWTYAVTNIGNIELQDIEVFDSDAALVVECPAGQDTLGPGLTLTCEATARALSEPNLTYTNLGTVTAEDPIDTPVAAEDGSSYTTVPADCLNIVPSEDLLWPPNHRMVTIELSGGPCGETGDFVITGVTQDEPTNGLGDGDTAPDAEIVGDGTVRVRRERSGTGNGRVYEISYQAIDGDAECSGSVFVGVPHDRHDTPVDDGQMYDSING